MKFVIAAAAFLAVIFSVQSSVITAPALGLGLNGLGLNGIDLNGLGLGLNPLGLAPVGLGINGLGLGIGGINGLGLLNPLGLAQRADLSGLGVAVGVPGQSLSQGPAIVGAPAINLAGRAIIGHGATYVAKTRGAIHTAPLDGHINSAASVNVAPAPGTL